MDARVMCECADKGCVAHPNVNVCGQHGTSTLYRVDMYDKTGTRFCAACADDAFETGLFRDCYQRTLPLTE